MNAPTTWSALRSELRRLKDLLADLDQAAQGPPAWGETVCCERSLGPAVPVERWYLAERFLTSWQEWRSSFARHLRYFGMPADKVPTAWKGLLASGADWQQRLWREPELDQRIAASWRAFPTEAPVGDQDAGALFRQVVASHHRLMMLPTASTYGWTESRRIARQLDRQVRHSFDVSPPAVRRDALWHLRQYRHATLDFSWLAEERWQRGFTAFEHACGAPEPAPDWLAAVQDEGSPDLPARGEIAAVTARVVRAIREAGFDAFVQDVTSREMLGGPDSPLGSDRVAVIGGHGRLPPESALSRPIVLALAHGSGRRHRGTLATVLGALLERLATAAAASAIVVADSWNASLFAEDFLPPFRELYDRGHRFLFLVAGAPKTDVARIPVTLSPRRELLLVASSHRSPWSDQPGRELGVGEEDP